MNHYIQDGKLTIVPPDGYMIVEYRCPRYGEMFLHFDNNARQATIDFQSDKYPILRKVFEPPVWFPAKGWLYKSAYGGGWFMSDVEPIERKDGYTTIGIVGAINIQVENLEAFYGKFDRPVPHKVYFENNHVV
jgi:hypothetical protein